MQASSNLSSLQRSALESAFTFFSGATPFLESIESKVTTDEKLIAGNLRDLARVCERKLTEAFPELLEWLREWERSRGVS